MPNKKMTVVKLKALAKEKEAATLKLSALTDKLREHCHHPHSTLQQRVEIIQSGILGMYETEITHEFCGICGRYMGDIA